MPSCRGRRSGGLSCGFRSRHLPSSEHAAQRPRQRYTATTKWLEVASAIRSFAVVRGKGLEGGRTLGASFHVERASLQSQATHLSACARLNAGGMPNVDCTDDEHAAVRRSSPQSAAAGVPCPHPCASSDRAFCGIHTKPNEVAELLSVFSEKSSLAPLMPAGPRNRVPPVSV